jgi:hypothetical protein
MPRLELFPFRYRNTVTGKWVKARYVAERHEIAARYVEWEIIGPPEIRDVDPDAAYFTPWRRPAAGGGSAVSLPGYGNILTLTARQSTESA